ncbi:MAG: addiction module protein [Verrucomicrobiota bacterium]
MFIFLRFVTHGFLIYVAHMVYPIKALKELPLKQKMRLVRDLWKDIASHGDEMPVEEWQKKELHKRHKNYLKNPRSAIPWTKAKKAILSST